MVTSYVSTGIVVSFGSMSGELVDVNVSGEEADMVDVTHQGSTSDWRQFLAGLKDGGEVALTLNYDPDAVMPALGGEAGTLSITWPTGASGSFSASAIFKGRGVSAPLGDKMVADFTFKITGTGGLEPGS